MTQPFRGCATEDLLAYHNAIAGRPATSRSKARLINSILQRRAEGGKVMVPLAPDAAVYRGRLPSRADRPASAATSRLYAAATGSYKSSAPGSTQPRDTSPHRRKDPTKVSDMVALMRVDQHENALVKQQHEEFTNDTITNVSMWLDACMTMRTQLESHRYLRSLVVALSTAPIGTKLRSNASDDVYEDAVARRRAEWLLNGRVERGFAHVNEVWLGVNRHRLIAGYSGRYVIENGASLKTAWLREKADRRLRKKLAVLHETRFNRTVGESGHATTQADEDGPDEDEAEADEIFAMDGDAQEDDTPSLHVVVGDDGVLQLSVYLAPSQHIRAMGLRTNSDTPTSASSMLFRCKAACIGPDAWLVLDTCPWRHKVLEFVWKEDAATAETTLQSSAHLKRSARAFRDVCAVFVDKLCFAKHSAAPCGSLSDPYVCTVCGAERSSDNLVYANRSGDLRRGKYPCAVCERLTLHIRKLPKPKEARRPWSSVRPPPDPVTKGLNHFLFAW
jgi:hypothetical protein